MAGLLLGYALGMAFESVRGGWAMMYVIGLPFSIVMFIGLISFPHSYRCKLVDCIVDYSYCIDNLIRTSLN
jgi:hypothetical protein